MAKIICHLCGNEILAEDKSREHIPPKKVFPTVVLIVNQNSINLKTEFTHKKCNNSYSSDEEYFKCSVGIMTDPDKPLGREVLKEIIATINSKKSTKFKKLILNEFSGQSPAGVFFPHGHMSKIIDMRRVTRVIWKIYRGIHYSEKSEILSEKLKHEVFFCHPDATNFHQLKDLRELVVNLPQGGKYPGIFDYKYGETEPPGIGVFGMLFWDACMFIGMFHRKDCQCESCK